MLEEYSMKRLTGSEPGECVADGTVEVVVSAADGVLACDGVGEAFLEGHGHTHHLHHRAGLVAEHHAVHGLDVAGLCRRGVQLKIGYGLDVAGFYLHEHGCSPFGFGEEEHLSELVLQNVLHGDVDGGVDVEAVDCRAAHFVFDASVGEGLHLDAVGAVEEAVEGAFKAGAAYDTGVGVHLPHTADAEVCHFAEGVGAL